MAKKKSKKKHQEQQPLSPERFLREKARGLEISKCFVSNDITICGEGHVVVSRLQKSGKISAAFYLVDIYCLGVKDSFYRLRLDEDEFEEMIDRMVPYNIEECSYEVAHNWIYGAIAFAEGDNFDVSIDEFDDFDEEEDDYEPYTLIETQYTYQHPQYPQVLNVENQWIVPELCDPKNSIALDDKLIDRILALPHDSLRRDLENLILYFTGMTCDHLPDNEPEEFNGVIGLCVMLLAEVGNEDSSLDVVLEVLRQSPDFYEYHICDSGADIFVPTIYKLGQHKLDKLMAFAKEEGIYTLCKSQILSAVIQIAKYQPKRRDEVIEWFREIIQFALEKLPNPQFLDSELLGIMISELIEIRAKELLKEIRALFDTRYVESIICGNYKEVEDDILSLEHISNNYCLLDIHKRFHHQKATLQA